VAFTFQAQAGFNYQTAHTVQSNTITLGDTGNFSFGSIDGDHFLPTSCEVIVTGLEGTPVGSVTASIGTNSPNYNNIAPADILLGLNEVGEAYMLDTLGLGITTALVEPNTEMFFRVSTPLLMGEGTAIAIMHGHLLQED
jgi:hypothetical protein